MARRQAQDALSEDPGPAFLTASYRDPLRLSPAVVLSTSEDGYLAYDVQRDRLYRLNATAALVVELCDGTRDLTKLRSDLEPFVGTDWSRWASWIITAVRNRLLAATSSGPRAQEELDVNELTTLVADLWQRNRILAAFVCQKRASELVPDDPTVWVKLGELAHIIGRRLRSLGSDSVRCCDYSARSSTTH